MADEFIEQGGGEEFVSEEHTPEFFEPHRHSDFFENEDVWANLPNPPNAIKSSESGNRRQIVSMEYDIVKKEVIISYQE